MKKIIALLIVIVLFSTGATLFQNHVGIDLQSNDSTRFILSRGESSLVELDVGAIGLIVIYVLEGAVIGTALSRKSKAMD